MAYNKNAIVYVIIECTFIHETDLAWLVNIDSTGENTWIPKSVSIFNPSDTEIEVEEWFLKANNIEY